MSSDDTSTNGTHLPNTICFFDFDGTITDRDTLPHFIQYAVGKPAYYRGLLAISPILLSWGCGFTPNHIAKQRLIAHFFTDWNAEKFLAMASQYSSTQVDSITRPAAMERIAWHQHQGHKIVVVSASMNCWLEKWCAAHALELISTQLEISDGRLSGNFSTKNCTGIEKASRIKQQFNLEDFDFVYAYGDSSGDREMLALADEAHYKPFR